MSSNRGVVYKGAWNLEVNDIAYPKFQDPRGKDIHHAVIIKVVSTNICGSDQHIFRGRFTVPVGHVLGHEITGEVVEIGKDVEFLKVGDIVSVPFNVSCGRCRNCKKGNTDVCETVNPEAPVGAYGFDLGGWLGGQSEYCLIPYADFIKHILTCEPGNSSSNIYLHIYYTILSPQFKKLTFHYFNI